MYSPNDERQFPEIAKRDDLSHSLTAIFGLALITEKVFPCRGCNGDDGGMLQFTFDADGEESLS